MKIIILFAVLLLLPLLAVGCTTMQPDDTTVREDNNVNEIKIQTMIDDLLSGELTEEEFLKMSLELSTEEAAKLFDKLFDEGPYLLGDEKFDNLLDRLERIYSEILPPPTEEQLEAQRIREEEHRRTDVGYIIRGEYTPAADDIDLQTIERVVFFDRIDVFGYGVVLDRMYGRVYYDPVFAAFNRLESIPFSAEFKDEDLDRLIQVIEKSGLRDWEEHYAGIHEDTEGGWRDWIIGILFSDGTILRRGGSGMAWTDVAASPDQLAILTDFIKTIGAEIEIRHNAEADINS